MVIRRAIFINDFRHESLNRPTEVTLPAIQLIEQQLQPDRARTQAYVVRAGVDEQQIGLIVRQPVVHPVGAGVECALRVGAIRVRRTGQFVIGITGMTFVLRIAEERAAGGLPTDQIKCVVVAVQQLVKIHAIAIALRQHRCVTARTAVFYALSNRITQRHDPYWIESERVVVAQRITKIVAHRDTHCITPSSSAGVGKGCLPSARIQT